MGRTGWIDVIPKELCPSASPSQQPLPPKPYTPITHSKMFLKGTFIFQALHLHQVNTASSHHSPVSLAYMGAAPYNQRSHQVGLVEQKSNLPKYNIKVFICSQKKKKPACNFPTTNFLALTFQIENSLRVMGCSFMGHLWISRLLTRLRRWKDHCRGLLSL